MTLSYSRFPLLPGPLVGREEELQTVVQLWQSSRLVTLFGQSGVGKSALARAASLRLGSVTTARICYLDAGGATTGAATLRLLAQVRRRLPARSQGDGGQPTTTDQEPTLFVLLDDLPMSAHEASRGVLQWLVAHPDVHLLVVTRRPLDLLGERVQPLTPLDLPSLGQTTGSSAELFAEFVRRTHHDRSPPNAETIAAICRALDGLPAALEAAAGLVGVLPDDEIARLAREAPLSLTLRGQPLRTLLAATWGNLSNEAQEYLAANAAWRGAFSAEAGAALASQRNSPAAVAYLISTGLLRVVSGPRLRYQVSPLIRALVPQDGDAAQARRRQMARRFLEWVEGEAMAEEMAANSPAAGCLALAEELPAIRWAWRWLAGNRDSDGLLRFARALAGTLNGPLGEPSEARELLVSALAHARETEREEIISLDLRLAAVEWRLGQLDQAEGRLSALLETPLGPEVLADAHRYLGGILASRGQLAQAVEHRGIAVAMLRERGDAGASTEHPTAAGWRVRGAGQAPRLLNGSHGTMSGLAWALHDLADTQRRLGNAEAAWAALEESHDLFHRIGCPSGRAAVLAALGELHADRDEWEEADWHARESQTQSDSVGDRPGRARALQLSARVAGQENRSQGYALAQAAAKLWESIGRPADLAASLLDVAALAQAAGYSPAQALPPARIALRLACRDGYASIEAAALIELAQIYDRAGRTERATYYAAEARGACVRTDELLVRQRCRRWEEARKGADKSEDRLQGATRLRTREARPPLTIRLLGPLTVEGPGGMLTSAAFRPREQRVLGRLAMDPGRPVTRDELLDLFWPTAPFAAAERSLRTVVSALRRRLRSVMDGDSRRLITARLDGYLLEPAACAVDATLFVRAVETARTAPAASGLSREAEQAWREAIELYGGDLLSGFPYEDWCLTARERLRDNLLDGLFQLARHSLVSGSADEARIFAGRMVEIDSTEERAHRLLMRCYVFLDRPADALRQYQRCAAALREELGARPAPATVALLAEIRAGTSFDDEDEAEPGEAYNQMGSQMTYNDPSTSEQ